MYAFALAISTPGEPSGPFLSDPPEGEGAGVVDIRSMSPMRTRSRPVGSHSDGSTRSEYSGERTSALYQSKVLGEFCSSDVDSVIPLDWVELAANRYETRMAQLSG
jgi:hypothetical protein